MAGKDPQVSGEVEKSGVANAEATTKTQGEVEKSTLAVQPDDVEKLKAEYEQKLAATRKDVDNVKSSLQRREAEITREYNAKMESLQQELHAARIAGMDEDQRKEYEENLRDEQVEELQSQLAELQRDKQINLQTFDAYQFFLAKGVPANVLVLNQGYEALVNSGWDWVSQELERARTLPLNAQGQPDKKKEPDPLPKAPDVLTDKSEAGKLSRDAQWAALRAKYGSEERVYSLVEQGSLDPSVIPL